MLEKAIKLLKQYQGYEPMFPDGETLKHAFDLTDETVDTLLTALRPVSREAWTAEWTVDEVGHKCSKCGEYLPDEDDVRKPQFCPECGRAMTDEAVEMVMRRLEALNENRD